MRAIGIIGGMGPLATSAFFAELIRREGQVRPDQERVHIVVDSDPTIPDRTEYILGRGADPRPSIVRIARRLLAVGCSVFAMPCNTAHVFARDVEDVVGDGFVDWIAAATGLATNSGARTVGVLATEGTLQSRLYEKALCAAGLDVVTPSADEVRTLTEIVYRAGKVGSSTATTRTALLGLGRALARRGAEVNILGCTELPLVVAADDPGWQIPALDPAPAVADRLLALVRAS